MLLQIKLHEDESMKHNLASRLAGVLLFNLFYCITPLEF